MHKWRIFWGGTIGHFWLFWETKTPIYNHKLDFWQTKCCQRGEVCRKRKSEFIIVIPIFRMSEKLEYWISEYSDIPEIFRHSDISELRNSGISYYWNTRTFQYSDIPDFLNTRIFRCSEIPKSGISEYDLIGIAGSFHETFPGSFQETSLEVSCQIWYLGNFLNRILVIVISLQK